MGLGARLVVESQGEGRLLCRSPPCKVFRLYIKWSLAFKHFLCWGGGVVMRHLVYMWSPLQLMGSVRLSRSLSKHDAARAVMTYHEY